LKEDQFRGMWLQPTVSSILCDQFLNCS